MENTNIYKLEFMRVKSNGAFEESNPSVGITTVGSGNLPHYVAFPLMANNPVNELPDLPTKWNHTLFFRVSGYDKMIDKVIDIFSVLPDEASIDGTIGATAPGIEEPFFWSDEINTKVKFAVDNQTVADFNKILSFQSYVSSSCQDVIFKLNNPYVNYTRLRLDINEQSFIDPTEVDNSIYHNSEIVTYHLWDALRIVNFYKSGYKTLPPSSQCYYTINSSIGSMLNGNSLLQNPSTILEVPLELTVKYNNTEYKKTFNLNN